MTVSRRILLRTAAAIPLALPTVRVLADDALPAALVYHESTGSEGYSSVRAGDAVLVDTSTRVFAGGGLYVYPDWGNPVVYEVRSGKAGLLDFYYPGGENALWSMYDARQGPVFAGKVTGVVSSDDEEARRRLATSLDELKVPDLPYI